MAQRKSTTELPCRGGYTCRAVFIFAKPLGLAGAKIYRPLEFFSVKRIFFGKAHALMVGVITHLIKHPVGARVHLQQPSQPPRCFIQYIGLAIDAVKAVRQVVIGKRIRKIAKGGEQMIRRVGRRCAILQVVRGVMPPAHHVDMRAIGHGTVHRVSIGCVARILQERIEATALLPHIAEAEVRKVGTEGWRSKLIVGNQEHLKRNKIVIVADNAHFFLNCITMNILRSWREQKIMLKRRFSILRDEDFEGNKEDMLKRLEAKLSKTRVELESVFAELQHY